MDNEILVYAKYDENNSIVAIRSSVFLGDTDGWTQIDEWKDGQDRYLYAHADNGEYVQEKHGKPLYDDNGRPNFHSDFVEWTEEEKSEYYPEQYPEQSNISDIELLKAQIQAIGDRNDFIEDCIAEMAMEVYQ